ncbi:MAG TPA: hypothetical protein VG759_22495 [Candidatus Angelobacter sp.]|nr:hypothetical protein [Candidatus Angelobacter sp.]
MENTEARLEAYRKRDPAFQRAALAFIKAEATLEDPVEGEPFEEPSAKPARPIQKK